MDNLDKLNNLNVYDYLTDEEKIQIIWFSDNFKWACYW